MFQCERSRNYFQIKFFFLNRCKLTIKIDLQMMKDYEWKAHKFEASSYQGVRFCQSALFMYLIILKNIVSELNFC